MLLNLIAIRPYIQRVPEWSGDSHKRTQLSHFKRPRLSPPYITMSKTSNIVAGTMASSGAPASSVQNEAAELEQLTDSLQERLVNSGEWDKLVRQLRKSLDKSEWEDDLRKYARGKRNLNMKPPQLNCDNNILLALIAFTRSS